MVTATREAALDSESLTNTDHIDKLQDMDEWSDLPPVQTVLALGARALWLDMANTGSRSASLTPRDRNVLALVATRPHGATLAEITDLLRRAGAAPDNATRWVHRLVAEGWLSREEDRLDLPTDDLALLADITSSYLARGEVT